jgi:acetolactate synthase-1/2/3 large subunit
MTVERAQPRPPLATELPSGAQQLTRALREAGIEVCFANPGTTEVAILGALEAQRDIRVVLCLFEGVATGAADGFGRMAGRPALTLLHCGPGLANGAANLHNARRARTPVVNLVGDHPGWHAAEDPPLASDIESLARPVSDWVRRASSADSLAGDAREAVLAASGSPGGVATLIVPADCQWSRVSAVSAVSAATAGAPAGIARPRAPIAVTDQRIRRTAQVLERHTTRAVLLLGGSALGARSLESAARIAARTGARLMCTSFPARLEQGGGLPRLERVPYIAEVADAMFEDTEVVVLVDAPEPVRYFADETRRTRLVPDHVGLETFARPCEAVDHALAQLADRLGAPAFQAEAVTPAAPPRGPLSGHTVALALAATLTEHAVVIDEGVSIAGAFLRVCEAAPRHSYLALTGGACGQGLPLAVGAALACPARKVVALVGDGSAMYTVQALWTQARHALDIVTLIYANDGYRILEAELAHRVGAASSSLAFGASSIDWVGLAHSLGVPASRATTADELVGALRRAMSDRGPRVIEVRVARAPARREPPTKGDPHG